MKKKTILCILLTAVAMCGYAGDGKLKVKLNLVDFGDTVVVYRSSRQETFVGKNGKFEFELQVDSPDEGMFLQPRILRGDMNEPRIYSVPLIAGEEMRIVDVERTRYDVEGTGFYADYHQVDIFNEKAIVESQKNAEKYRDLKGNGKADQKQLDDFYNNVYQPSVKSYHKSLLDYIKAHPKQEAAVMLVRSLGDIDKMKEGFSLFAPSVREGRMKTFFESWLKKAEENLKAEEEEKEAAKKQATGIKAPTFTLNDLNGKPLALTSLRGKYVILDFWGSWCVWCIKGFPKMKEYYAKYPGKFEILGMDCGDTEAKWKEAVKKHELPWLHVYCPNGSSILNDYGITGFPTKIIIGPDGKIVKTIVGEDPSFYTLLDELFGK